MLSVTVKVTNLTGTERKLSELKTALSDMSDVMESLAMKLIPFYRETVFASQGEAIGERWASLKDSTLAEKNAKWPGRSILVRTGEMQESFRSEVMPNRLFISNDSPHFIFHQVGTSGGAGRGHNIPARKMLEINSTVEEIIRSTIKAGIRTKIDRVM